ncbi:MAG: HPF/RaiA family ribosome-associated protein [Lewinellaceae bacterium]|nr:HPF/RaiA family ribosome-associated protein [Lewinellaceae bacterium]
MLIQINTDKNITVHDEYNSKISNILTEELDRFSNYVTRVELFLSDENGSKKGVNDKRCLIEARVAGRKPMAVTEMGNTYDLAVKGAVDKMKIVLDSAMQKK